MFGGRIFDLSSFRSSQREFVRAGGRLAGVASVLSGVVAVGRASRRWLTFFRSRVADCFVGAEFFVCGFVSRTSLAFLWPKYCWGVVARHFGVWWG